MVNKNEVFFKMFILVFFTAVILLSNCRRRNITGYDSDINGPPICEITSPNNSSTFISGTTIEIQAIAIEDENIDGIRNVKFCINDSIYFIDTTPSYSYNFNTNLIYPDTIIKISIIATDLYSNSSQDIIFVNIDNGIIIEHEMISIPSGNFDMGQEDIAMPIHNVNITNSFEIAKYEITNFDYVRVLNIALEAEDIIIDSINNSVHNAHGIHREFINFGDDSCKVSFNGQIFTVDYGMERRPVTSVTWYGASFYCNIVSQQLGLEELYDVSDWSSNIYPDSSSGFRLPTEAEWEFANRFNDNRTYPWGEHLPTPDYCNYGNIVGHHTDVGTYSPIGNSHLGISDLAGNVSEWCNDWFDEEYYTYTATDNPTGPLDL